MSIKRNRVRCVSGSADISDYASLRLQIFRRKTYSYARSAHHLPHDDPLLVLLHPASLCSIRSSNGSLFLIDYDVIVGCPNHPSGGAMDPIALAFYLASYRVILTPFGSGILFRKPQHQRFFKVGLLSHSCLQNRQIYLPIGQGCDEC